MTLIELLKNPPLVKLDFGDVETDSRHIDYPLWEQQIKALVMEAMPKEVIQNIIILHLESGGWCLMSTYLNSGDVVDLVDVILAEVKEKVGKI